MLKNTPLTIIDVVVIVLYFMLILGIGFYSFFKGNRSTVSGYFLAGRYMIWLTVGGSLFASNIGSEHFVGLAGSGASSGIGVAAFEFNAAIVLQLLGCLFLPVYIASGANTLPEYMKKRFGGKRIRTYLSCLYILLYIFAKISVDLYSGALFIERGLNWNMYPAIFFVLFMTVICTVTGGLTAVMYMDTVQTFLILFGAAITAIISVKKVGGFQSLRYKYMNAIPSGLDRQRYAAIGTYPYHTPSTSLLRYDNVSNSVLEYEKGCGLPRSDSWIILRNAFHSDVPWLGILLGQTTVSLWYWCTDQMMVQRALAAKSLSHAQGGTIFVGYLKLLPLFLLIIPGMASRVLYPDLVACSDPEKCQKICGNKVSCANIAYPLMAFDILPAGLKGVMFSVMLAALMSDLASVFNSSSTLFTIDIWQKVRRNASVRELMIVGRCFILVMVAASVAWIPIIESFQSGQLYLYIQSIGSYLAPPIACVFLLAVLWPRCNEPGAFWSMMIGLGIGLVRMILDLVFKKPGCGWPDNRPAFVGKLHFLYFAAVLFWITAILCVTISYLTQPPDKKYLIRTTYWTRFAFPQDLGELKKTTTAESELRDDENLLRNQAYLDSSNNTGGSILMMGSNATLVKESSHSEPQSRKEVADDDKIELNGFIEHPIEVKGKNNKIPNEVVNPFENSIKTSPTNVVPKESDSTMLTTNLSTNNSTITDSQPTNLTYDLNHIKKENFDSISNLQSTRHLNGSVDIRNHNWTSRLKKAWNWFMGFETEELHLKTELSSLDGNTDREIMSRDKAGKKRELEQIKSALLAERLEKIQSLNQNPNVAFFIKFNVLVIVSLAIFIMLYFSF